MYAREFVKGLYSTTPLEHTYEQKTFDKEASANEGIGQSSNLWMYAREFVKGLYGTTPLEHTYEQKTFDKEASANEGIGQSRNLWMMLKIL